MKREQDHIRHDHESGTLTLVATPIGNLEDITMRAIRTLKEADLIAAEDTRRTRILLSHYGLSQKIISYYEHNEEKRLPEILKALLSGMKVALVSDAGTPGISDPGYRLVQRAIEQDIPVTAVPGPSAAILALTLSGLPTDRFSFLGFLPRKKADRGRLLEEAAALPHTLLFFESPRRIDKSLQHMLEILGDRKAALARELTKRFEEVERGLLSELIRKEEQGPRKGEFCIAVAGRDRKAATEAEKEDKLRQALEELKNYPDEPLKEASKKAARKYGLSRRDVYQAALGQARNSGQDSEDQG